MNNSSLKKSLKRFFHYGPMVAIGKYSQFSSTKKFNESVNEKCLCVSRWLEFCLYASIVRLCVSQEYTHREFYKLSFLSVVFSALSLLHSSHIENHVKLIFCHVPYTIDVQMPELSVHCCCFHRDKMLLKSLKRCFFFGKGHDDMTQKIANNVDSFLCIPSSLNVQIVWEKLVTIFTCLAIFHTPLVSRVVDLIEI